MRFTASSRQRDVGDPTRAIAWQSARYIDPQIAISDEVVESELRPRSVSAIAGSTVSGTAADVAPYVAAVAAVRGPQHGSGANLSAKAHAPINVN